MRRAVRICFLLLSLMALLCGILLALKVRDGYEKGRAAYERLADEVAGTEDG